MARKQYMVNKKIIAKKSKKISMLMGKLDKDVSRGLTPKTLNTDFFADTVDKQLLVISKFDNIINTLSRIMNGQGTIGTDNRSLKIQEMRKRFCTTEFFYNY